MKRIICIILINCTILIFLSACGLLRVPIDNLSGFSKHLEYTENYIRSEEWQEAISSLENAQKTWRKIKPVMQIDIDHDYVNEIELKFSQLATYLECREKSDALVAVSNIKTIWENIASM